MQDVLNNEISANGTQKDSKLKAPAVIALIGVLSDVSELIDPEEGNSYVILTFTLPDGDVKTLPVNASFWMKLAKRYPLDSYVRFSVEKRVANKTQFVDRQSGSIMLHAKTGEYFKTINRIPEGLYAIEVKKILGEDLENRIVGQEDSSKQMALATFYSNFYRS